MGQPYVGEIRLFAGNFAPQGWNFCNGAALPISQFDVLFNLIGTTYGGDGINTFNLPDLSGRVPIHPGPGHVIGQVTGSETVTLTTAEMPQHSHSLIASSSAANQSLPGGGVLAVSSSNSYGPGPASSVMAGAAVNVDGGSQPHQNMAPYGCLSYIISLFGVFPSQS